MRLVNHDFKFDVAPASHGAERIRPLRHKTGKVHLLSVQVEFAALIFAEIEYLVNQTVEYAHILIGYFHKCLLRRGQVASSYKLLHRFGNQCQRCAEVMRHIGEKHQLGLCSLFELPVELPLQVTLFLKLAVLRHKFRLMTLVRPERTQQQENHPTQQHQYHHCGIHERGLRRVPLPEIIDLRFEFLKLRRLLA